MYPPVCRIIAYGKASQKAFSLVELLLVTAMIGTLLALAVPAMSSLSKSGELTRGGNLLVDLANEARQKAMSRNAMTALVMVSGSGNSTWDNRSFLLMELLPGANAWTVASRWYDLPEGVVLDASQSGRFLQSPALAFPIGALRRQGKSIAAGQYAYQVFLPSGELTTSGVGSTAPPVLHLVEGFMNGEALVATGGVNYYEIAINQFTGIPQALRP